MVKKRASERHIKTRLQCAHYLFRAGNLDSARKMAREEAGFGSSSGPWLTALGLLLEWQQRTEKRDYLLVCKEDLHPIVEVARDDLGCIGCFRHDLKPEDLRRIRIAR